MNDVLAQVKPEWLKQSDVAHTEILIRLLIVIPGPYRSLELLAVGPHSRHLHVFKITNFENANDCMFPVILSICYQFGES